MKQLVITEAVLARENAYVPYSKFKVGAALLLKDGAIIRGCNVENASYGLCNCAERTALFTAYAKGYRKDDIVAMSIAADTLGPVSPCGSCRQVLSELIPMNAPIYLVNTDGVEIVTSVKELLPLAFTEESL